MSKITFQCVVYVYKYSKRNSFGRIAAHSQLVWPFHEIAPMRETVEK